MGVQKNEESVKKEVGDSEKKAVLNFLKDKNEEKIAELHSEDEIQKAKEENEKLNATLGFNLQRNQIYNGFLRGKSVNYN